MPGEVRQRFALLQELETSLRLSLVERQHDFGPMQPEARGAIGQAEPERRAAVAGDFESSIRFR